MVRSDSLYKYTRLEFVNSTINNGIFASPIDRLNDPYECAAINNPSEYRVVCLSRSRNQKLMWSHYADGHRGCSIKIALPNNYGTEESLLKRVSYCGKFEERKRIAQHNEIDGLLLKDKKWEKELEVRAIYKYSERNTKDWKKYRSNIFLKVNITQIDFGCFSHYDPHYLDALISIRDYNANHKEKIRVRKYKMSSYKFEFVIDKDFDYIKEIADIINTEE